MNRKAILVLSSLLASALLVGGTFAGYAVTDAADPLGVNINAGELEDDDVDYVTLAWGSATSLSSVQNMYPGKSYRMGVVSLKSTINYPGVFTINLTDQTPTKPSGSKYFIDYVKLYLYEGDLIAEEGKLPTGSPLVTTSLGATNLTYLNALGTSAGKPYSIYIEYDGSALEYSYDLTSDLVNVEVDWSPQEDDILNENKNIYLASYWDSCNLFAWSDKGRNSAWPGVAMTKVGRNELGQNIYKGILLAGYEQMIFNNGSGTQTADLPVSDYDFSDGELLFYLDEKASHGVGSIVFDADRDLVDFAYNMGTNPGPILHAWGWTNSTVKSHLNRIAEAGYKAVQISPMQPVPGGSNTNDGWYMAYQPLGFKVADSGQSPFGDKTTLTELTEAADAKGIDIIVDVVANHLHGGNGELDSKVGNVEPYIYQNRYSGTMHNTHGEAGGSTDVYWITHGDLGGVPDVNTGNTYVQNRIVEMLKEYIDCGVKGFRFDAAKHIETPKDWDSSSNFWPHIIGNINGYGVEKYGKAPYSYGEILGSDGGRDWSGYTDYIDTTDYSVVWSSRENLVNNHSATGTLNSSSYNIGNVGGEYAVLYGESHDNFIHDGTGNIYGPRMNSLYGWHTSRNGASSLYFARPSSGENHGNDTKIVVNEPAYYMDGSTKVYEYAVAPVRAANKLHTDFEGGSEYLGNVDSVLFNVRQKGSSYGIYLCDVSYEIPSSKNVKIHLYNTNGAIPQGTYINLITNSPVTVYGDGYVDFNLTDNVGVLEFLVD